MQLYTLDNILKILQDELSKILERPLDEISTTATLMELRVDSIDYIRFLNKIGKRLKIEMPKKNIMVHIAESVKSVENYWSDNGLTDEGVKVLKKSLYQFSGEQVKSGMLVADIQFSICLKNWANTCLAILNTIPSFCGQCKNNQITITDEGNRQCTTCNNILSPLPGDVVIAEHLSSIL